MVRDLRDLPRGDESADGNQAPIPRRQARTQPKVTEQYIAGVLHDSRSHRAEILLNTVRALRLGGLIKRKWLPCGRRKLSGSDVTFAKDVFRDRNRRHGVAPA